MMTRSAIVGLLGVVLLAATPATAKADFGFSFGYNRGCSPVYYESYRPARYYSYCEPTYVYRPSVVVYDDCYRPAYTSRVVYRSSPRYYRGGSRVYYRR